MIPKAFLCMLSFMVLCSSLKGQIDTTAILKTAHQQAEKMTHAFQQADYDQFLTAVHPKIVRMMGGKEASKKRFAAGIDPELQLGAVQVELPVELWIDDISYQTVFLQRQEMEWKRKPYYTLSSLIGISYDQGQHWYFLAVTDQDLSDMQAVFPELRDELKPIRQTKPIRIRPGLKNE